jgi:DNA-binding SARP family transcriptional activator
MEVSRPEGEETFARGGVLSDLFDALPTGILVLSPDLRIVTWNPALESLLGADSLHAASSCCDLLGCGEEGQTCIGDLARAECCEAHDYALSVPGQTEKVVVTPGLAGHCRSRNILLQFRPATDAGEAASPLPAAPPGAPATLRIRTLGRTVLEGANGDLNDGWLDRRPGHLLKFLIAHRGAPVHADAIAEALWPGARTDPTNTVRHFVHGLREKLEPNRGRYARSQFVLARGGGYQLNPERVTIDVDEFEAQAEAGLDALDGGEIERALEHLEAAIELYRGDFLPDERYEDWAIAERERLLDLACQVLRALADVAPEAKAADYLERLAELEPLDADIQRALIATLLRQGRRTRAMRRYRTLQSRLMREFGERITFDLPGLGDAPG